MRVVEGFRHAAHDAEGLAPLQAALFGHELAQSAPVQVLERHVEDALLGIAPRVVHHHETRVGEPGRDLGLRAEAPLVLLPLARVSGQGQPDGLEGDRAAEVGVLGLVDDAHHPAPELLADLVPADRPGEGFFAGLGHGSALPHLPFG